MKTNRFGAVQGDVPIIKIAKLSDNAKKTNNRTVAYGEVTGHHHTIYGECEVYETKREIEGQLFPGLEVVVTETVELRHQEHDTIEMIPGIYFIPSPGHQQVEYDGENERRVLD